MAIPSQVLAEPLLSRKHAMVLRDIARVALLIDALKKVKDAAYELKDNTNLAQVQKGTSQPLSEIENYLKAEIRWVLTQVKLPKHTADQSKSTPDIKKSP